MPCPELPPELKIYIAEQLSPGDCLNFAVGNKATWELCGPVIKSHQALSKKYGSIEIGNDDDRRVWSLLDEVLADPDVAYHIRKLTFGSNRNVYWDRNIWMRDQVTVHTEVPPQEDIVRYLEAAERSPYLGEPTQPRRPNGAQNVNEAIRHGSDAPIIVLLLCSLPNLRELELQPYGDHFWIKDAMKRIAQAYANPSPSLPLQRLTKLALVHWDTEFCINWDWVRICMSLPSLRVLNGFSVGGEHENITEEMASLPKSNVTTLRFVHSNFDLVLIAEIIRGTKDLKRFEYENGGAIVSYATYDGKGIVAALLEHASHSLKYLSLEDCDFVDPEEDLEARSISLREFQQLKTLRIKLSHLLPDDKDESEEDNDEALSEGFHTASEEFDKRLSVDLSKILPVSLEHLHVLDLGDLSDVEILSKFLDHKDEFPNLNSICADMQKSDELEVLLEKAEALGLEWKPIKNSRNVFTTLNW